MLKWLICFMLLVPVLAHAQVGKPKSKADDSGSDENEKSREKLILLPFTSELVSSYDAEYVNRIAARIVAQQQKYHLVISKGIDDGSKLSGVFTLKIELFKELDDTLRLELRLLDNNRNATVKRVLKEDFLEKDFKVVAELALLVLFGLEEDYARAIKVKQERIREKVDGVKTAENRTLVDFRKRILDLKSGIEMEFKIVDSKPKVEGEDTEPENPKDDEEVKEAEMKTVAVFQEMENVYAPRGPQKVPHAHTIFNWYSIGAGTSDFLVTDRAGDEFEVQIRTELTSLMGNIYTEIWPPYFSQHAYFARLGVRLPMFYSEDIQPPNTPEFDIGMLGAYFGENLYVQLGVRKESYVFANLPVLGEGTQLTTVDVTWGMASVHLLFWDRNFYVKHEFASQLSSDFDDSSFTDGSLVIKKSTSRFGIAAGWFATGSYIEFATQSSEFEATGKRNILGSDKSSFVMWQLGF